MLKRHGLSVFAVTVAALLMLPVLVILSYLIKADGALWQHMFETVLNDYLINSLLLLLGVGSGVLLLGVPTAWLTSMCDFPGRRWLSWALLLPLAVPAYIIAYTYTGLLDFAGPVQTWIRDITGLGYGDYWFFEIRSLGGAIVMMSLVLYPYVYLMARAAFLEQSVSSIEVGCSLGYSRWRALWSLALPMARPAIVAGLSLALMETLADYGTVQYFGVSTFTTGIFRTFYGYGDTAAAAQLAASLLAFVILLVMLERYSRRRARYHSAAESRARADLIPLTGSKAFLALMICLVPLGFGFVIPAGQLLWWAVFEAEPLGWEFVNLAWNSFCLAFLAALVAVTLAILLAYAQRARPIKPVRGVLAMSGFGYALPGTIIAIGVLIPLAWIDHRIIALFEGWGWDSPGLILSGSLIALLFAYTVRFLAVALGSVQAGLEKIKPSLDYAGRSMGHSPLAILRKIHVPLMRSSVLTAVLIVFVDVLKELPATLILRPFNFNTMAVRAYELASDERLVDAAPASIMIVLVGLIPVLLLHTSIARRRPQ
ncbi:MAG: iron ABC transporter permease [Oceanospirillaceae bacterium]|jgi:iron(III) transport system permease protein|nr:iron ABC transporter permease [Oceanospirillaceae bacterium]MBT7331024.1 iron ABC transporter permease [Oceanospirillaceae bacterium]